MQLDVLGMHIRIVLHTVGQEFTGLLREDLASPVVVHIHDTEGGLPEQHRLRIAVVLHRSVEIQMILRQVGKRTDRKLDAVDTVEHQRVGGYLHQHVGAARIRHLTEQLLQLKRLGRRALGRDDLLADHVLVGADQTDLAALRLQNRLDQIGGRGLAVGAGDADHLHFLRRMGEVIGRHLRQCAAGRRDLNIGNLSLRDALAYHCGRTLFHRLADVFVSIGRITGDRNEYIPRLYSAGVILQLPDLCRHRRRGRYYVYSVQDFL